MRLPAPLPRVKSRCMVAAKTTSPDKLARRRANYAHDVSGRYGPPDPAVEAAFAEVPREAFLGPPPWRIGDGGPKLNRRWSKTSDPAKLYQDVLVTLNPEKGINNGQPSLHALCIAALRLSRTDHALHIGTGMGYYTAIIAQLAGSVDGYELEPDLAGRAEEPETHESGVLADTTPPLFTVRARGEELLRIDLLPAGQPAIPFQKIAGQAEREADLNAMQARIDGLRKEAIALSPLDPMSKLKTDKALEPLHGCDHLSGELPFDALQRQWQELANRLGQGACQNGAGDLRSGPHGMDPIVGTVGRRQTGEDLRPVRRQIIQQQHPDIQPGGFFADSYVACHEQPCVDVGCDPSYVILHTTGPKSHPRRQLPVQ